MAFEPTEMGEPETLEDTAEPVDLNAIMDRFKELFPQPNWQFTRKNQLHLYHVKFFKKIIINLDDL